uniref:Uncharacterized protein n=1 Tax=Haptolina ericina TaxID=156174 RepID=A0A7S3EZF2_9EUKA
MQAARKLFHEALINRFDTNVPRDMKKFWFLASLLDPHFKKLVFKNDRLLSNLMRERAITWLKISSRSSLRSTTRVRWPHVDHSKRLRPMAPMAPARSTLSAARQAPRASLRIRIPRSARTRRRRVWSRMSWRPTSHCLKSK